MAEPPELSWVSSWRRPRTATADGNATVTQQRAYQLVRQRGPITDRTAEITFPDPGVQAYVFTFG